MLLPACLFVAGIALAQSEPALPDPMWCALLPVVLGLMAARVRASPLLAALAGYAWAVFLAHVQMGAALPVAAQGRDVEITVSCGAFRGPILAPQGSSSTSRAA